MKKIFLLILLAITLQAKSQNIAFVSQDNILASIPKYKENTSKIDNLKKEYQEEIKVAKDRVNESLQKLLASYTVKQNEDLETIKKRMNVNDISKLDLILEEDKDLIKVVS